MCNELYGLNKGRNGGKDQRAEEQAAGGEASAKKSRQQMCAAFQGKTRSRGAQPAPQERRARRNKIAQDWRLLLMYKKDDEERIQKLARAGRAQETTSTAHRQPLGAYYKV